MYALHYTSNDKILRHTPVLWWNGRRNWCRQSQTWYAETRLRFFGIRLRDSRVPRACQHSGGGRIEVEFRFLPYDS